MQKFIIKFLILLAFSLVKATMLDPDMELKVMVFGVTGDLIAEEKISELQRTRLEGKFKSNEKISPEEFLQEVRSKGILDKITGSTKKYSLVKANKDQSLHREILSLNLVASCGRGHLFSEPCMRYKVKDCIWTAYKFALGNRHFTNSTFSEPVNIALACALVDSNGLDSGPFDLALTSMDLVGKTLSDMPESTLEEIGPIWINKVQWVVINVNMHDELIRDLEFESLGMGARPKLSWANLSKLLDQISVKIGRMRILTILSPISNSVLMKEQTKIECLEELLDVKRGFLKKCEMMTFSRVVGIEYITNFLGTYPPPGHITDSLNIRKKGNIFEVWISKWLQFEIKTVYVTPSDRFIIWVIDPEFGEIYTQITSKPLKFFYEVLQCLLNNPTCKTGTFLDPRLHEDDTIF